jgi:hypothetical protein
MSRALRNCVQYKFKMPNLQTECVWMPPEFAWLQFSSDGSGLHFSDPDHNNLMLKVKTVCYS